MGVWGVCIFFCCLNLQLFEFEKTRGAVTKWSYSLCGTSVRCQKKGFKLNFSISTKQGEYSLVQRLNEITSRRRYGKLLEWLKNLFDSCEDWGKPLDVNATSSIEIFKTKEWGRCTFSRLFHSIGVSIFVNFFPRHFSLTQIICDRNNSLLFA